MINVFRRVQLLVHSRVHKRVWDELDVHIRVKIREGISDRVGTVDLIYTEVGEKLWR